VVLVPLYMIVLTSFSTQASVNLAGGMVLVPHGLTTYAYQQIFTNQLVLHSMVVSVGVTVIGTALSMVVTIGCAYGLSRARSFGHRTILALLVVTMFFSGGLIPSFLLVSALGGYGRYWSLILPGAVSVFNILVMRAFFAATAQDLVDAARIDGAGDWRILRSVVLPTSRPVLAVITLFYAVGYWNTFFNALLYLPDNGMWPLQMVIYTYTLQGNSMPGTGVSNTGQYAGHQQIAALSLQMAVVTLTLIPIVIAYPFAQRHFSKGMLTGAIKG
jgi:putative aldouronate transport system permease protein